MLRGKVDAIAKSERYAELTYFSNGASDQNTPCTSFPQQNHQCYVPAAHPPLIINAGPQYLQ